MKKTAERVMILGGSGMVGFQIARQIAKDISPGTIFIVALHQASMRDALQRLRKEFPKVTFDGAWGNIFARTAWRDNKRSEIVHHHKRIEDLLNDTYAEKSSAAQKNLLADLIRRHKPEIIVDAIATATRFAYQDEALRTLEISRELKSTRQNAAALKGIQLSAQGAEKMIMLLANQSIPLLIRHVQLLNDAMISAGTRIYLKVGTTGAGGMGLSIPYTHSEDKSSSRIMYKTAIAFAHTGLLFLMARTPGAPIIKEIKPATLIGSRQVEYRPVELDGKPVGLYHAKKMVLADSLRLHPDVGYAQRGELAMVGVNTGNTGFLTLGEFEAATTMYQLEFITPEEIAQTVVLEIKGLNTGNDIVSAVDAAVMDPSYRAGLLRSPILAEMKRLEAEHQSPSVALGQLGPPEFSKLLYEAWLIKAKFHRLDGILQREAEEISRLIEHYLLHHPIRHTIVSIGIPVLMMDGNTLLRGPRLAIPEFQGTDEVPATPAAIDSWAQKGWVDLRPGNMARWQERIRLMQESCKGFFSKESSDMGRGPCPAGSFEVGEAVGWLLNNDPEIASYRVKAI